MHLHHAHYFGHAYCFNSLILLHVARLSSRSTCVSGAGLLHSYGLRRTTSRTQQQQIANQQQQMQQANSSSSSSNNQQRLAAVVAAVRLQTAAAAAMLAGSCQLSWRLVKTRTRPSTGQQCASSHVSGGQQCCKGSVTYSLQTLNVCVKLFRHAVEFIFRCAVRWKGLCLGHRQSVKQRCEHALASFRGSCFSCRVTYSQHKVLLL
jgi:hypothetical protein